MDREPRDMSIMGERELVLRAQDGDVPAFEELVDRTQGPLFRFAMGIVRHRADAEDLVQETLLTAWRRLRLLEDPTAFRGWLLQICSRRATDLARRGARRRTDPTAPVDLPEEPPTGAGRDGDPFAQVVVGEQMRTLADVLDTLEPSLRSCWVLREFEGLGYAEIASALGLTESTVRGRLARARQHIIETMEEWR